MKTYFRFDDICINTDMDNANAIALALLKHVPNSEIIYCLSPMVHDMSKGESQETRERIFPAILNAHSDYRLFYTVDKCGLPEIPNWVKRAAHGLVHVDHRLMPYAAQEVSILTSCSLAKASIFVPPFNKWNTDTDKICKEHSIELVKFEDGWLSMEHNSYKADHYKWYLHSRAFDRKEIEEWLTNEN